MHTSQMTLLGRVWGRVSLFHCSSYCDVRQFCRANNKISNMIFHRNCSFDVRPFRPIWGLFKEKKKMSVRCGCYFKPCFSSINISETKYSVYKKMCTSDFMLFLLTQGGEGWGGGLVWVFLDLAYVWAVGKQRELPRRTQSTIHQTHTRHARSHSQAKGIKKVSCLHTLSVNYVINLWCLWIGHVCIPVKIKRCAMWFLSSFQPQRVSLHFWRGCPCDGNSGP